MLLSGPMQGIVDRDKIGSTKDDPAIGPADSKVEIIDFSDYYCPSCVPIYEESIKPALEEFAGRIRFVSRQVIAIAHESYFANHASLCAHEQGFYWQMHEKILFRIKPFVTMPRNMDTLNKLQDLIEESTADYFIDLAATIEGIDAERFAASMKSDCFKEKIYAVSDRFKTLNLKGVPVTVINDRYFMGYLSPEEFRQIILTELENE